MNWRACQVEPGDNVATMIVDTPAGAQVSILYANTLVVAREAIARGHKIALVACPEGDPIVKFGVRMGHSTRAIERGEWVHLHNCASDLDRGTRTFDPVSSAPEDTSSAYV